MAKEIRINKKNRKKFASCLTDSGAGTEKVMDITNDCPKASEKDRAILLFTRDTNGRIVQISRPSEGKAYGGILIHFHVDNLDREMNAAPRDDTFGSTAEELGLTKAELRILIKTHAPD